MHQSQKQITETATSRLDALQEFSSLGSGYSLAFRDLQIRGAGELLGAKQHGAMAAVGYELFTQIINEEVQYLKSHADGDSKAEYNDPLEGLTPLPTVDLPVRALIPDDYIADQAQRLFYYKEIMSSRSPEQLGEVKAEILDRYGAMPEPAAKTFAIMEVRMKARDLGIDKIDGQGGRLAVHFSESVDVSPRVWSLVNKKNRECYLARDKFIWPFSGDPIAACERMVAALKASMDEIEAHRAALEA